MDKAPSAATASPWRPARDALRIEGSSSRGPLPQGSTTTSRRTATASAHGRAAASTFPNASPTPRGARSYRPSTAALHERLHLRLHLAFLGLGRMGTRDRLDGPPRLRHAASPDCRRGHPGPRMAPDGAHRRGDRRALHRTRPPAVDAHGQHERPRRSADGPMARSADRPPAPHHRPHGGPRHDPGLPGLRGLRTPGHEAHPPRKRRSPRPNGADSGTGCSRRSTRSSRR